MDLVTVTSNLIFPRFALRNARYVLLALAFSASASAQQAGAAANVSMYGGNGQMVLDQFRTTAPMTIRVTDSSGVPVSGVSVSWSVTKGFGTLEAPSTRTDSNGEASAGFLGSLNQPGLSYATTMVRATTSVGSITFVVTTVPYNNSTPLPTIQLLTPASAGTLTGTAGSTLAGAIKVAVQSEAGISGGQGIPNIGLRIVNPANASTAAAATCNATGGTALTGSNGTATCDLVLSGTPGTYSIQADVGEYTSLTPFTLIIKPGATCAFTVAPTTQSFSTTGGQGTVAITTTSNCSWTASSNAAWITVSSSASGSGNASVQYTVAANTGASRSGTLSVAGKTITVTQDGSSAPAALSITNGAGLAGANLNASYSATLSASGGQPPYTWSITSGSLPPGLSLDATTGIISGTATTAGTYPFTATVTDSAGATQAQGFTLAVSSAASGLSITNTSFPNASTGVQYQQVLNYAGMCGSPFSPRPAFTLASGLLPPGLSVQLISDGTYGITGSPTAAGVFQFALKVSDTCGDTATASFSITVTNGASGTAVFSANPQSLTFTSVANVTTMPLTQTVALTSTGNAFAFTTSATTTSGGNWLSALPTAGSTPTNLYASIVNASTLAPGTYLGIITVTSQGGASVAIPVTLVVASSPAVTFTPSTLTFTTPATQLTTTSSQTVALTANVAGLPFAATAQTQTGGNWLSVTPASGTGATSLTVSVQPTGLPAGTYTGTVSVTPTGGTAQTIPVTMTVTVAPTLTPSSTSLSFNYVVGAADPVQQTVNLTSTANGAVPVNVSATTTDGANWLAATAPSGSGTAVTVSVLPAGLLAGTYHGTVTIAPQDEAIAATTVAVTLTVTGSAAPVIDAVTNAASFQIGPVSPGELVVLFGAGMATNGITGLSLSSSTEVATALANTTVLFDGTPAPLIYVSPTQIGAVVPYSVAGETSTQIQVQYQGESSNTVSVQVATSDPGIFTTDGKQAAALNEDNSVNTAQNGLAAGSVITLYATGEGQTNPGGTTGEITTSTLAHPVLPVTVQIGGQTADVLYAGSAPGLVEGVLQVNARVPSSVQAGTAVPVVLTVGTVSSATAMIAVK